MLQKRSYYISYRYQRPDESFVSGYRIFQTENDLNTEQGFVRELVVLADTHCEGNVPLITYLQELLPPCGTAEDFEALRRLG